MVSPTSAILSSRAAALLPAFIEGFQSPREYFLARLGSLGPAAAAVNAQLDALGAASLGGVPCLLVGGTADELALSASEVPRLQALLGAECCAVHLVRGAGHSGTLDDRIDLRRVMAEWQPSLLSDAR